MLYFAVVTRSPKYHYYIFIDDDVVLSLDLFASPQIKRLPPSRLFEQWLLEYDREVVDKVSKEVN